MMFVLRSPFFRALLCGQFSLAGWSEATAHAATLADALDAPRACFEVLFALRMKAAKHAGAHADMDEGRTMRGVTFIVFGALWSARPRWFLADSSREGRAFLAAGVAMPPTVRQLD